MGSIRENMHEAFQFAALLVSIFPFSIGFPKKMALPS